MSDATMTSKGQVTIPKDVRDALGLGTGVRISFRVRADGVAEITPIRAGVGPLRGMLRGPRRATIAEMEEGIADGATRA